MSKNKYIFAESLSNFLDLLRWTSALVVVLYHLRTTIMVPYDDLKNNNVFIDLFYFITSLGPQAVIVFFVLSGFLVGGNTFDMYKNGTFKWKLYLINRTTRLYIVLIPALIFGLILDLTGSFNFPEYYTNMYHFGPFSYNVIERLNIESIFINLTMLQTSFGPQLGSNGPLWSLAFEFWYYILFPVLLGIYFNNNYKIKFFYILFIIFLFLILNMNIFIYFIYWIIGAVGYQLMKLNINKFQYPTISILIFVLVLYISTTNLIPIHKINLLFVSISCSYMIYAINIKNKGIFNFSINKKIADFSYTVYLFHAPLLLFFTAIIGLKRAQPSFEITILYLTFLFLIYIYSYLMFKLFESKTNKYRKFLKEKLIKS